MIKITPYFKWYDLWMGIYIDVKNYTIYFGYFPMLGLKVKVY